MWDIFNLNRLPDTSRAMRLRVCRSPHFFQKVIILGLGLCFAVEAIPGPAVKAQGSASYTPIAFGVGTGPIIDGLQTYSGSEVKLDISAPILTLDYGADVAGYPYFEVTSLGGPAVQIELKYSEQFPGLTLSTGDGPL